MAKVKKVVKAKVNTTKKVVTKAATKKVVAKKVVAKKTVKKSTVTKTVAKKVNVIKQAKVMKAKQTRTQIIQHIAEYAELSKKQVDTVFDVLADLVEAHMKKGGSGEFSVPKLGAKIRRIKKKATKARKMISPLTGEEIKVAAKPARQAVKVSVLKALKEMIS